MAATATGRALTDQHRVAQQRLGVNSVPLIRATWQMIDTSDLDGTVPEWLTVTTRVVQAQRDQSARLAGAYMQAFRAVEIDAPPVPVTLAAVPDEAVATSLLTTGPYRLRHQLAIGTAVDMAVEQAIAASIAAAIRHILNGGRDTIHDTARDDPRSVGWMRVTGSSPCAWCAMIASRGPVYWTRATATAATAPAHRGHDACRCSIEPMYRDDSDWPASSRRWRDLWDESTRGLSGEDARRAFRRALEGGD